MKIINVDTQVKEMDYVDAYVGSDNQEAGRMCGEALVERCPQGGKVLLLECPTQNSINDRITGFEEAISGADPGFEIVARENTDGMFEKSLELARAALEEHPDVTAIMCGNDQIAVGAQTAVNLLGLDDVVIYGGGRIAGHQEGAFKDRDPDRRHGGPVPHQHGQGGRGDRAGGPGRRGL